MRILLVTQWFDPEPTIKGLQFASELRRRGHQVSVITGFPNYPGGKIYDGYRVRIFQREVIDGVRVLRVPLYPSHDGSALRRILNYVSFALAASVAALVVRRPDVAYVYHPPATAGLPAAMLRVLRRVPVIYDVQDLWPDTLAATGMVNHSGALKVVGWVMRRIYRVVDHVVVLSPGFKTLLEQRGIDPSKVTVIRNWSDETIESPRRADDGRSAELGFGGQTTVTFAGNVGAAQSLETVLEAAGLLRDIDGFRFLIIGDGIELERIKAESNRSGLENVHFHPRVAQSEIGEYLRHSDALLVHLRDDPLFKITIPSKTQAYLRAGRPLLVGVSGDARDLVQQANAGIFFEPGDAESLAGAVRELLDLPPEARDEMGRSGRAFYDRDLALSVGVSAFERVLGEAVEGGRPHSRHVDRNE